MKPSNDREAVTLILDGMVANGWSIDSVIDDTWNQEESTTVTSDVSEATDLIMGVDEGFVNMSHPTSGKGYIYFVLGNSPEEVACDYTVNLDPDLDSIVSPWWN